ncbi:MAG: NDMA-dependent alcohol dehydrogenase [Frankiales bacterium]|nr:NDMA-dependent alcohol dehydrogenase [Frankiales bacterium]
MKTKGAVLRGIGEKWSVEEIEVGDPVAGEVMVELAASGLCHSDEHVVTGSTPTEFPFLGGHEGAGVVTKVGPGVIGIEEGDHVVTAFIPACGQCPPCSSGHQNLCDLGAHLLGGPSISDGTYRVQSHDGAGITRMCQLGTFSPYITVHQASVVKIEKDIPLQQAALVGCGVSTGWGSATRVADVRPGETVAIMGIGGVGINSVQGAAAAGAKRIIAIDPVAWKREKAMEFGATETYESMEAAQEGLTESTWGRMAEKCIITVGEIKGEHVEQAMNLIGKGGRVVVTGMGNYADMDVTLNLFSFTLLQKDLQGAIFGGSNPRFEIPWLLSQYREGKLNLDDLTTTTYTLEDINQGYQDMKDGKNLRGVVVYTDADR